MNYFCRVLTLWMLLLAGNAAWAASTVTFIHYNDLHAHLTPHLDVVADAAGKTKVVTRGGVARAATLIKRIRHDNPNSILMNIGDTYHGGVEALFTNGNAIVASVNALGIDVGVPGNWDFAYGPIVTRLRYVDLRPMEMRMLTRVNKMMTPIGKIERPNFPNLAANVSFTQPFWKSGKPFLPATLMLEKGGVKVGLIGLTSDIVPRMHPMLATGLSFLQGEGKYRDLVNREAQALRAQGAQIVVVMSELGLQKNYRLAQIIDAGAVDVLFSAHTHEAVFTPLKTASGTWVVEAGNDGYVGRMDVTVEQGKVSARHWKLQAIDASTAEDPEIKKLVEKARAPFLVAHPNIKLPMMMQEQVLDRPINTVVGHVKGALDRRNALESSFNAAYVEALRQRGQTQIGITPGFRMDAVIAEPGVMFEDNTVSKGVITIEDVYRFFPVSYTISTARVSGERLKSLMEEAIDNVFSPDAFVQNGGWLEGWGGLRTTLDLTQEKGARVKSLVLKDGNSEVKDSDSLTVTGCSRPIDEQGVLCSYSGFEDVQALINPSTKKAWSVADIFMEMVSHKEILAAQFSIVDQSATPQWPVAPYIQPLQGIPSKK